MTSNQRKLKKFREDMNNLGYESDRWGHYKMYSPAFGCNIRLKVKARVIRIEEKTQFGWVRIDSMPVSKISMKLLKTIF
jgi:hypothetical protein